MLSTFAAMRTALRAANSARPDDVQRDQRQREH
jgi:hypothetical protein